LSKDEVRHTSGSRSADPRLDLDYDLHGFFDHADQQHGRARE
jgi:hypothetical protein